MNVVINVKLELVMIEWARVETVKAARINWTSSLLKTQE